MMGYIDVSSDPKVRIREKAGPTRVINIVTLHSSHHAHESVLNKIMILTFWSITLVKLLGKFVDCARVDEHELCDFLLS